VITIVPEDIECYIEKQSEQENAVLRALASETRKKAKFPQMMVGQVEGAFLRILVRAIRAQRVLEIGTFTGYSALAMAEGLPSQGRLMTLDNDPDSTSIARDFWLKSPHGQKIELRLGNALDVIHQLDGPFDLVFMDADKENYINYWEACLPKVRTGGLLVADNVLWSGRVLHPKEKSDRALVAFNDHVKRDRRVEVVMLSVRDGITLASKK